MPRPPIGIFAAFLAVIAPSPAPAASSSSVIEGRWFTIDEDTGRPGSVIRMWVDGGKLTGQIDELVRRDPGPEPRCTKCEGALKDKPFLGLKMMWGLEQASDTKWQNGRILDPTSGTVYRCEVKLVGKDQLDVRGYVGVSLLGRTVTWRRAPG